MALTIEEALNLSPKAIELGEAIGRACSEDSPGGRKVTRAERQALLRMAIALAAELTREALD